MLEVWSAARMFALPHLPMPSISIVERSNVFSKSRSDGAFKLCWFCGLRESLVLLIGLSLALVGWCFMWLVFHVRGVSCAWLLFKDVCHMHLPEAMHRRHLCLPSITSRSGAMTLLCVCAGGCYDLYVRRAHRPGCHHSLTRPHHQCQCAGVSVRASVS